MRRSGTFSHGPNWRPKVEDLSTSKKEWKSFNISKVGAADIIEESGIKDWREEIQHLRNQLSYAQVGCPGPFDQKQKKRGTREIIEQTSVEKDAEKEEEKKTELS